MIMMHIKNLTVVERIYDTPTQHSDDFSGWAIHSLSVSVF